MGGVLGNEGRGRVRGPCSLLAAGRWCGVPPLTLLVVCI